MMPRFDNERVAFAQARWGHLNRDFSVLTVLQSLSLDAHFAVDQAARSSAGHFFNFNGTAGVWRRAAIVDAGGWRSDTLTEDLDLSYRTFLRGWQARYAGEVEAAAELPVSFSAVGNSTGGRGSMECAIRFRPRSATRRRCRKLVASMHRRSSRPHAGSDPDLSAAAFPSLSAPLDPVGWGLPRT
jgi:cellulose synthase/poly-beta-1,6-N-acetylglucosamine synthase-like glycosyltransferase